MIITPIIINRKRGFDYDWCPPTRPRPPTSARPNPRRGPVSRGRKGGAVHADRERVREERVRVSGRVLVRGRQLRSGSGTT